MKIISQLSVFDYKEIEILGDLERFKLLISNVPDKKIINKLNEIRGKGRNDYSVVALWNSLLITPLLECSTINQLRRVFTEVARDSIKWKRLYKGITSLERINGRLDRDFNLENHKVRGLKKARVLIDIMMIGMLAMAKGHIINKQEEKLRCLKS